VRELWGTRQACKAFEDEMANALVCAILLSIARNRALLIELCGPAVFGALVHSRWPSLAAGEADRAGRQAHADMSGPTDSRMIRPGIVAGSGVRIARQADRFSQRTRKLDRHLLAVSNEMPAN